ncbi:MAG: carboxypeptidase regulatory-like domain-containing protein [Burkholderiales bacterium]|nr:carboxypeptidase regulatory-like domain-containing protein [Burkholderiales bacterium]
MSKSRTCKALAALGPLVTAALALGAVTLAHSGVVSGAVVDGDGKAVAGAIVTLADKRGVSESVYSDAVGGFRLATGLQGELDFWVRMRYYRDDTRKLALPAGATTSVKVTLAALTDARAISEDSPPLAHFSTIAFDPDEKALFSRPNFARDCVSCHALGEAVTRQTRPLAEWSQTVQRMHAYLGNGDPKAIQARSEMLAKAFDGSLVSSRPVVPVDPLLFTAKVRRWRLDTSLVPHDPAVHSVDNRIYTVDMMGGKVLETDLASGTTKEYAEPADGMPSGGVFTKMGMPAPYGMTVPRGPHSLAEGKDGKFYLTDLIGNSIGVFDPKTKTFEHHPIPMEAKALYPHTIRAAGDGKLWFTIAFSNQVGRFDPASKEMKIIALPDSPSLSIVGGPSPYGIDIHPADGSVWYAKLAADRIGRIDPKTLEIKEFDSPVRGPRRHRFDAHGKLWVAGFSEGAIARIDVRTWQSKVFRLPVFAPGQVPSPYALAVHPRTGEVWVNDTMLDLVWRFLPKEERFVAYPLPLKGTYTREFTFPKQGWACTTNNSLNRFIEGGMPELICIDTGRVLARN